MNFKTAALGLLAASLISCQHDRGDDRVCYQEHCFSVEIAATLEARQQGLMGRRSLPPDRGMLFVFPESGAHRFWMKNTLIPLDIIWLDFARRIVHIENHVPPCQTDPCPLYAPGREAFYVLELNAGEATRLGMKESDVLVFQISDYLKR